MLLKLLKHEIRATFKQMWPIYAGMLALTLLCRFIAFPILSNNDNFLLNTFSVLLVMAFFICLFILAFMPLLISGFRFKKSILQDEGYLTMTLPVSSHQLIISKLIVNAIWYGITGILMAIILTILVSDFNSFAGFDLSFMENDIKSIYHLSVCSIELLVNYIVLISLGTLIIYASYAIGYSVNKHKSLLTTVLIFVFFHLTCWVFVGGVFVLSLSEISLAYFDSSAVVFLEVVLLVIMLFLLLICAVYYFVTNFFITRKLNLE